MGRSHFGQGQDNHNVESIFHLENRGDSLLDSIWASPWSCMGLMCSASEESPFFRACKSNGLLGDARCLARVRRGSKGRRGHEHHAAAAGIRREGWTSTRSQTGSLSMGGGHATMEKNHQREWLHPPSPLPAQQAAWPPCHKEQHRIIE